MYSYRPNDNEFYSYYVIKKGDTLNNIGREMNLNPKLIAELNGLKYDEYIYPNQTIIIPKKNVEYYITKDDDTLKTVSNIFNVSQEEVVSQNRSIYLLPSQIIYYKR